MRSYAPPLSPFAQATALPLALIHPAFMVTIVIMIMVIMATIMLVTTLMIVVTGSANAVSVHCAERLGYRGGAMLNFAITEF